MVLIAAAFAALSGYPLTHLVLDGVGAAAVGLSLQMGLIAARRAAAKGVVPVVIMVVAFVAVGLLHLSLPLVVLVLGLGQRGPGVSEPAACMTSRLLC